MIKDGLNLKDRQIRSFLLIGQSNMAGRGAFGEVPKIDNPSCYMLRMGRWQRMREPINPDRPIFEGKYPSGVSLGASFADEVAKKTGESVGLIPCADGGTRIDQWMPGEILFDHAVMMTRLAMRTSTLSGILWHQGESDCKSDDMVLAHKEKFVVMISALRQVLGAQDLPLLIGELSNQIVSEAVTVEYLERMTRNYHEIAAQLPHCAMVSSDGLTLKDDGLHFNSQSLRVFGKRYADAYFSLTDEKGEL